MSSDTPRGAAPVRGDDSACLEDANVVLSDQDLDALSNQPVRNAVADRVDADEAIGRDATLGSRLAGGR